MKRRTSFRAPFVVTLAASAALGCGASVTPAEPGDASPPGDAEPSTDVQRACPPTLPTNGSPCVPGVDPASCTDPSVSVPGCPPNFGVTVVCEAATRRWQTIVSSCNPPPVQCPSRQPVAGSSCPSGPYYLTPTLHCEYSLCGDYYAVQATCTGPTAQWQVQETSCNPPPPVQCPTDAPARGTACPTGSYSSSTLRCQYQPCGDYFSYEASCAGPAATWEVQQSSCNPPPPMCPATPPAPGSACSFPSYISCAWGSCDSGTSTSGFCADRHWAVGATPCTFDAGAGPDV